MKLALKKMLNPAEIKLLKKVAIISIASSVLIVGTIWLFQFYHIHKKVKKPDPLLQSTSLQPIDIEAHKLTARRYLQCADPERAIPHLQRTLALNNKDFQSREELANAYLDAGYYQKALEQYNLIPEKELPESINALIYARKGIASFYLGEKEQSRATLDECLTRFPKSAEAACFLGQIEATVADTLKSLSYLQKAIAIDSSYTEAWYQISRIKMMQGKYLDARQILLKALQIEPLHAKSHSRLGMVYYYLKNPELARTSYQTALALNPSDFNTHYNLGELYYSVLNDTVNALREFKETVKLDPMHIDANFRIGLICVRNGMLKESIRYFENALSNNPGNIRILLQQAAAFEKLSLTTEAVMVYNKILDIDVLNSIARQKIKMLQS
jgi:tetratricopeptide (TPR) repeat protein